MDIGNYTGAKAPVELPKSVFRIDNAGGALTKVTDDIHRPNGLCF